MLYQQINYETAVCNLCGCAAFTVLYADCEDKLCGLPGKFNVVRCNQCRLIYTNPRPTFDSIGFYYLAGYLSHNPDGFPKIRSFGIKSRLHNWLKEAVRWPWKVSVGGTARKATPPRAGARILDIGCGAGGYLASMAGEGRDLYGCDISWNAITKARLALGFSAKLWCGTIEALSCREAFDLVTMWHVLEHIHDPLSLLEHVIAILKPKGMLHIAVPNIESFEARLFGREWSGLGIPRHLYHFSPRTIAAILERVGFEVVDMFPAFFPSSISDSLDFVIEDLFARRYRRPDQWYTYYLTVPFASLSYLLRNKGILEITAQKST